MKRNPLLSSSQKTAMALLQAERALADWHDEAASPHGDISMLLSQINHIRQIVQSYVEFDASPACLLNAGWNPEH